MREGEGGGLARLDAGGRGKNVCIFFNVLLRVQPCIIL